MRILLNAVNAVGSGAAIVVQNLLEALPAVAPQHSFVAVLPPGFDVRQASILPNVDVVSDGRRLPHTIRRMQDIYRDVARWCRQYEVTCCFTLGDVGPARLPVPQAVLLHQPFIAYRLPEVERLWPPAERLKFRFTRWQFGRMAPHCAAIFVQTPVMARHLGAAYRLPPGLIHSVPQTVPASIRDAAGQPVLPLPAMLAVDKPCRLLFLAAGYEHKNHAILPELAAALRRRGLDQQVHIFTTLDPAGRRYEQEVIRRLEPHTACITNLGRLSREQVVAAFRAAHGLFLPTLAESFGLIYLEAMAFGVPILTSDRDFARWMCEDLATYFDPGHAEGMADAIAAFASGVRAWPGEEQAARRVEAFPATWEPVAATYLRVLETTCGAV